MLKQVLFDAVKTAAAIMKDYSTRNFSISNKEGINNLVTEVDHKCEEVIFEIIRKNYPDHYILSEESGEIIQDSNYKWIIDPIDGTVNYANRIPVCCVSIGIEKDGSMELGAVYNPFIDELFFAERGKGATLNGQPIQVSKRKELVSSCLVTGFPYTYLDMPNGPLEVFGKFIRKGVPVRRLGSAAIDLCYVAAGRFDGFFEHKLNAWDSAAGFLIIEEAGGKVTDMKGNPYNPYQPGIIATNGIIHDALLKVVQGGEVE
ncbi:inositol monophosphatase family protein [Parafilimonas sp.]|uniref:inositol monophosphatase family protein n=1 Tax=Parafilimonas sp. TaxID=1969739 RepID=UPI0039E6B3E3